MATGVLPLLLGNTRASRSIFRGRKSYTGSIRFALQPTPMTPKANRRPRSLRSRHLTLESIRAALPASMAKCTDASAFSAKKVAGTQPTSSRAKASRRSQARKSLYRKFSNRVARRPHRHFS